MKKRRRQFATRTGSFGRPLATEQRLELEPGTSLDEGGELAKTLAAEDIRCGDIVAILDMVYEYPSFLWCDDPHVLPPQEPVYVRWRSQHTKKPLKVKAICLPYILVKTPKGRHGTLDVRQCRLVRLSDCHAKKAWKQFRKAGKKKKKS